MITMSTRIYSTRTEAIQAEIIDAIEATGVVRTAYHDYEIDAIAAECIVDIVCIDENGVQIGNIEYMMNPDIDSDKFWDIVQQHEIVENPMVM